MKNPNPQGKGLPATTALLSEINRLAVSPAKHIEQIANELFTSLFVLQSQFKFRPVIGKSYWLYQKTSIFRLSLIGPEEWKNSEFGIFIGRCELHPDMTWSMELSDKAFSDPALINFIEKQKQRFDEKLNNADRLEHILPAYESSLAFYQRAFLAALSHSLGTSMAKSGITRLNYEQAQLMLEKS